MMQKNLLLVIAFSFCCVAAAAQSLVGPYTINKTMPTAGTNFNSFADFSAALTASGVTGNVTATVTPGTGPYTEQVIFQNITGIGAAATVTIEGSGETITSDTAIIQTGSNPNRHIIRLIDLQYFTVNNLHINMFPGSTGFIGVHILNSGNHMTISNCVVNMGSATSTLLGAFVANGNPSSILTPGGNFDYITITGNTVTGGGYGASVNGLTSPLATNVVISNNTINDFNSNGVYLRETNGAEVSANHFDKSAGSVSSTNAIQLAQAANINGRVFGNFIKMSQTSGSLVGIYLFDGTGHKVYNNLIYDINSTTGDIEGIRVRTGGTAPEIYFNTISFNNANTTSGDLKGFNETLSNTGSLLRNNIFSITQPTSGTKTAIGLASSSTVTSAVNSNYNVFWIPGGNVGMRGTTTAYPTLNAWRSASTQDAASFETDPSFVATNNPIPQSGVINNQAQTGTGITTDITGAPRGVAPDPGAYEFTPPGNDAAITDFILPPIPHCANTLDVQFELTNAGGNPLNSVTINWTVNSVPQPVVNWTGPTLAPGLSTVVTLGTVPVTGSNSYNFSATASNPNGGPDANPSNDTYTYNGFRRGIEGALTINQAAPASATNYINFQSAANALSQFGVCTPVTITVMNGPYNEQVVFNTIPGTSATNTVTLNGNNQTLEYNPTVTSSDHILQLNAVNYMIVENIRIVSLHVTQGRGIHITNGSSKLVIRNNEVNVSLTNSTSSSFGIIISGANWLLDGSLSDSVVISGNTVTGGYSAIQLSGVHWNTPLTRISVINNNVLDWYGFGVYLSYTNGALVSKNNIRRPTRTNSGSDAVTPAGITVPAGSLSFLLEKNRIYDLHGNMAGSPTISRGIHMSGTTTAPTSGTIQNNLIYGMNNDGAQYGIQNNSVTGPVNIFHNTVVLNNATSASTSNTNAINLSNFTTQNGIDMRNNIFVLTRGGTGTKRIIDITASTATLTTNYNVAYLNAPGGTQFFGQIGSTNYNTLLDWQGTGRDLNSVSADPQFVNPPTGNFAPSNSVVDGAAMGTSAVGGITEDILNVIRAANPDAGAFEFSPGACSTPAGGTANTASGPFCNSGSGTITASGYSTGAGISYQWQYSNDNFVTNINDLAGEVNPASAATGVITATTWYRLKVTCSVGPTSSYSTIVSITVNQPVNISSQPLSQTVCAGANVSFSVVATGGVLSYQWRKNGTNIGGANASTYTISNVTLPDAGNYDVLVSNSCGTVTSGTAILAVNAATAITTQPVSQAACAGDNVTFNVVAAGAALTYQWRKNGTNIGGANAASFTISNVSAGDAGNYDVVVTGTCGTMTSSTAVLSLNAATSITTQPLSQAVCPGANVIFSVSASGTSLAYQWRKNGTDISGATASTYTINNITAGDAGNYDVTVTGTCGAVTSATAVLSLNPATAISSQPASQAVCAGSNVSFMVTASGTSLTYQWRKNGSNIPGANASVFTLNNVSAGDAGTYDVLVSGSCGNLTSAAAVLSVTLSGSWTGAVSSDWNTSGNWCGGIPTATSDVLISPGAPNMPVLSNGNGLARNMTINSGASVTVGSGGNLDIYGNLVNNGTFNAAAGNLGFRGTTAQSIAAFTTTQATMNGSGGVLLTGNATVTGTLTLSNGHITLGSYNLTLASGSNGSPASHIITNSTGTVIAAALAAGNSRIIPVGINASNYNPVVLSANAGHITDHFSVQVRPGVFENGISGSLFTENVVDRTWIINEAQPGGSNLNISLQWAGNQELTNFQRSRSFIMRHDGTNWVNSTPSAAGGADPFTQTLNGVTAFSPFAVKTASVPLGPVGIYPIPTEKELNVVLEFPGKIPVTFTIYDALGRLMQKTEIIAPAGISRTVLQVEALSSGVYFLNIATSIDYNYINQRFVKIH